MATCRRPPASLLFFLVLHFLFVSSSASPPPSSANLAKTLCDAAPYQDLCHQSTSVLSPNVTGNITRLACTAVSLSLDAAKAASAYLSEPSAESSGLLHNCVQAMADCVDLLLQSVGELDSLDQPGSPKLGVCVRNVKTWASAAVADASACLDSLPEALTDDGLMVDMVKDMVMHTLEMTSNAQVFVDNLEPKN